MLCRTILRPLLDSVLSCVKKAWLVPLSTTFVTPRSYTHAALSPPSPRHPRGTELCGPRPLAHETHDRGDRRTLRATREPSPAEITHVCPWLSFSAESRSSTSAPASRGTAFGWGRTLRARWRRGAPSTALGRLSCRRAATRSHLVFDIICSSSVAAGAVALAER
jgi:hypothetical protein